MFRNYLTTALRHLLKNRLFSVINVFGLAIGLMACILILLFVRDELSFDTWLKDSSQIVRLHTAYYPPDRPPFLTVRSAGRMMQAVEEYAPDQVEAGVRMVVGDVAVRKGDKLFSENAAFVDGSFFNVFDLPFVKGSAASSFSKPMDLVITEKMALKYFGRTDVIGETLSLCCLGPKPTDVAITGVIKDLPRNSHMRLSFLARMDPRMFDFAPNILKTWTSVNTYTYFKLKPGITAASLQARIARWEDTQSPFTKMVPEGQKASDFTKLKFMPVPKLHLYARKDAGNMGDLTQMGDINSVYAFSGVALLILIIASINFMNLSTARAATRAREVAVRKVHGASRFQVAVQFLGEAVMITAFALLFALVGVELVLPYYNDALGRTLDFNLGDDMPLLGGLVGATILIGLISGSYPATYLSGFLPAKVLKANKSASIDGASRFRALLVVFQFAVSIGLIVCTAVIYVQTVYARNMDLGYVHDGKLVLGGIGRGEGALKRDALVSELKNLPGVKSVVMSSEVPSEDNENNTDFKLLGSDKEKAASDDQVLNYHSFGYGFFDAYGIKPIAGRTFDRAHGTDEIVPLPKGGDKIGASSAVINETAMHALGIRSPQAALGRVLRGSIPGGGTYDLTIIGVIPDIYFRSIKFSVRPTVYVNNPARFGRVTISFNTGDVPALARKVDQTWRTLVPSTPIDRDFLDDMIGAQYQAEEREAQMFAAFSVLAVIVACLGLYGLAAFTAEQRTKEIGIRKVLGATTRDIVQLLIWQFSRPVLIANVIAWPIAWYAMSGWLQAFQYRIGGEYIWILALIAGGMALAIAWVTVASRAIRVARANPIHALRYE